MTKKKTDIAGKLTVIGDEPSRPRQLALSKLYSALAAELVQWQQAHQDTDEMQEVDDKKRPVVVQLHEAVRGQVDGHGNVAQQALTDANALLEREKAKLGGVVHQLEWAQVVNLSVLMYTNKDFRSMAPYRINDHVMGW